MVEKRYEGKMKVNNKKKEMVEGVLDIVGDG